MRIFLTCIALLFLSSFKGQENYRDFESIQKAFLGEWNGVMDSTIINSFSNSINSSSVCAKYIRSSDLYDNFKLFPLNSLVSIEPYADTAASAPRLSMKVRTSAAPGTLVKIQLGTRTSTAFPAGVHSEYTATTSVSNAWELLTFNYWMSPVGGYTATTDIDKIVVFFHPNSSARDTVYFDDPSGPELIIIGVQERQKAVSMKLFQNIPNPAKLSADIRFQLNSAGKVTFQLNDLTGRAIISTALWMEKGLNTIPIDTELLHNGVYFYTVSANGFAQTKRMIISK
jgi:hypothetical protein